MAIRTLYPVARSAPALALCASLFGCQPGLFWPGPACTLIGCTSGPRVDLPTLVDEGFRATVETDVASGSFQCPSASLDGGVVASQPTDVTGDFAAADPTLLVSCTPEGFWLAQNRGSPPPQRVSVEAEGLSSGTAVADVFEDIVYEVSQPNGPGCEPTCHNAVLTLPAE